MPRIWKTFSMGGGSHNKFKHCRPAIPLLMKSSFPAWLFIVFSVHTFIFLDYVHCLIWGRKSLSYLLTELILSLNICKSNGSSACWFLISKTSITWCKGALFWQQLYVCFLKIFSLKTQRRREVPLQRFPRGLSLSPSLPPTTSKIVSPVSYTRNP